MSPVEKKIRFIYIEWFLIFELFSVAEKLSRNDSIFYNNPSSGFISR
jgi:hypothetical protein